MTPTDNMKIYKVGGAVRDQLLGRPVTEVDWVVVGATAEQLLALGFRPVGNDFPVFLHPQTGDEYALARTERKSGKGYGGFVFYASPEVTLEQDLGRRDLTINAMAQDADGRLIDPYQGQADLEQRLLRHVSPAFVEDPLRVLRVARFAARYAPLGFTIAPQTLALMTQLSQSGELAELTAERCWKEISRALMESRPEVFIQVLHDCNALAELFPALEALFARQAEGPMMNAMRHSAEQQQPLEVRWACLLRPLAGEPDAIARLNQAYKVPKGCQDAALLQCHSQQTAMATQLRPAELDALLKQFDIQRRPWRLEQFVAVERLYAQVEARTYPQGDFLLGAAERLRAINPAALMAEGHRGAALGQALEQQRLTVLASYQQQARP